MNESRPQLAPGTRIRDTYTVVRFIGAGRFADVYLVRHRYLGMQAMKLLVDTHDEDACHEAFHEAFLLSRITHPGIVRVFDANRAGLQDCDSPYITMEYVDGETLADLIGASAFGLRPIAALELALQLAHAVSHAHSLNTPVVHRDLKPANILLEDDDGTLVVRVADFGLARAVDRLTDCVAAAGTLLYMSPESLRGFEMPASDVFSMGLILHELLAGVLPFPKSSLRECANDAEVRTLLTELHQQSMLPPSENDAALGPDIDYLVGSMLATSLDERVANASEASVIIDACLRSRRQSSEEWDDGSGRKPAEIAFRIARDPSKQTEAVHWLEKATALQPDLMQRLQPFIAMFSTCDTAAIRNSDHAKG